LMVECSGSAQQWETHISAAKSSVTASSKTSIRSLRTPWTTHERAKRILPTASIICDYRCGEDDSCTISNAINPIGQLLPPFKHLEERSDPYRSRRRLFQNSSRRVPTAKLHELLVDLHDSVGCEAVAR
jgi:hypothetical protein